MVFQCWRSSVDLCRHFLCSLSPKGKLHGTQVRPEECRVRLAGGKKDFYGRRCWWDKMFGCNGQSANRHQAHSALKGHVCERRDKPPNLLQIVQAASTKFLLDRSLLILRLRSVWPKWPHPSCKHGWDLVISTWEFFPKAEVKSATYQFPTPTSTVTAFLINRHPRERWAFFAVTKTATLPIIRWQLTNLNP